MHKKYIFPVGRATLEGCERIMSHRGLAFHELFYSSPLLNAVHQMNSSPLRTVFHFDRNDLSHIFIFEQPGIGFAAIPCTWYRYAKGLSLKEHREVRSRIRQHRLPPTEEMHIQVLWQIRTRGYCRNFENAEAQEHEYALLGQRKTLVPKTRKRESPQDYALLMARLGNEVRGFGLRGHHD